MIRVIVREIGIVFRVLILYSVCKLPNAENYYANPLKLYFTRERTLRGPVGGLKSYIHVEVF